MIAVHPSSILGGYYELEEIASESRRNLEARPNLFKKLKKNNHLKINNYGSE